jgi:hypothetical protein
MNENFKKIILDLCGGTGSWSKPYRDAGYDVKVITLLDFDVTDERVVEMCIALKPYGILCATPATAGELWLTSDGKSDQGSSFFCTPKS